MAAQPAFEKVVIVGAGDVGTFIGALISTSDSVTYLGRDSKISQELRAAVAEHGLTIKHTCSDWTRHTPAAVCRKAFTTDASCLRDATLILVCTKRSANKEVAKMLTENVPVGASRPPVIMMQNGLGAANEMTQLLGSQKSSFGGVTVGCVTLNIVRGPSPGTFLWTTPSATSQLCFDAETPVAAPLAALIRAAGCPSAVASEMDAVMAGKLIMNMWNSVNAISGGLPLSEMLPHPGFRRVISGAQQELIAVYKAGGVAFCTPNHEKDGLLTSIPQLLLMPTWVVKILMRGMLSSKDSKTSMGEDRALGRKETEVDYLNGVAVDLGKEYGVYTPINAKLQELVHGRKTLNASQLLEAMGTAAKVPPIKYEWVLPAILALAAAFGSTYTNGGLLGPATVGGLAGIIALCFK